MLGSELSAGFSYVVTSCLAASFAHGEPGKITITDGYGHGRGLGNTNRVGGDADNIALLV